MKAYVINLDRDRERWAHVERQGRDHGIAWTRIAAVDKLSPEIVQRAERATPGLLGVTMSAGAIACFESHRKAWQMIIDSGETFGAVFEDDVVCSPSLPIILSATDWIPGDCDVVKLETFLDRATIGVKPLALVDDRQVVRLYGRHLGACAYILPRTTADRLLHLSKDFADPVDDFLFNAQSRLFPRLTLCQLDPAPCIQGIRLQPEGTPAHLKSSNDSNRKGKQPVLKHGIRHYLASKSFRTSEKILYHLKLRDRKSIPFR